MSALIETGYTQQIKLRLPHLHTIMLIQNTCMQEFIFFV